MMSEGSNVRLYPTKHRVSIRVALLGAFAFVVLLIVAMTLTVSLESSERLAYDLAVPLIRDAELDTEAYLREMFSSVSRVMARDYKLIKQGFVHSYDPLSLRRFFLPTLSLLPQAYSVTFTDSTGYEFLLARSDIAPPTGISAVPPYHRFYTRTVHKASGGFREVWTLYDSSGLLPERSWKKSRSTSDSRERSSYSQALAGYRDWPHGDLSRNLDSAILWGAFEIVNDLQGPAISASIAVRDPSGKTGVITYNISLDEIGLFTQSQHQTRYSQTCIVTSDGMILGLRPHSPLSIDSIATVSGLDTSGVSEFKEVMRVWSSRTTREGEPFLFHSNEERWWGGVHYYHIGGDKGLWIAVALPEADLLPSARQGQILVISISGLAVLFAAIFGIYLSRKLSSPLKALVKQSKRISEMDLRPGGLEASMISEVDDLSWSLETMRRSLQEYIRSREEMERTLRRREAIVKAVNYAAEEFLRSTDIQVHLKDILSRLGKAAEARHVFIIEYNERVDGKKVANCREEWLAADGTPVCDTYSIDLSVKPFDVWRSQLERGEVVRCISTTLPLKEKGERLREEEETFLLLIPIHSQDELWGLLGLQTAGSTREFSQGEIGALKTAAGTFAAALERNSGERRLRILAGRLHLINRIERMMSSSLDLKEIFEKLLVELTRVISFDRSVIIQVHEDERTYEILSQWSSEESTFREGKRYSLEGSTISWLMEHPEPLIENDLGEKGDWWENAILREAGLRSRIVVPLISKGKFLGIYSAASNRPNAYSIRDLDILAGVADQLAVALENAELYRKTQEHARELEENVASRTSELRSRIQEVETLNQAMVNLVEDFQILNKHLEETGRELKSTNEELESFSYSVSHDLRAPLRAIDGFARVIQEDLGNRLDAEVHKHLDVIRSNTRRMGELIDDLLRFSRVTRKELHVAHIDLGELILKVYEEISGELNGRSVEFHLVQLPTISCDASMMRQVFTNLLSNAIKFTSTTAHAAITIESDIQDGKHIIAVKDNGVGFDTRYAGKLFGVFQRLHTEDEFEGTGVGLAIVKRVIRRHGGDVWATSVVGEGTTIFISLPTEDRTKPESNTMVLASEGSS